MFLVKKQQHGNKFHQFMPIMNHITNCSHTSFGTNMRCTVKIEVYTTDIQNLTGVRYITIFGSRRKSFEISFFASGEENEKLISMEYFGSSSSFPPFSSKSRNLILSIFSDGRVNSVLTSDNST